MRGQAACTIPKGKRCCALHNTQMCCHVSYNTACASQHMVDITQISGHAPNQGSPQGIKHKTQLTNMAQQGDNPV
jgi:hypothetical protein